MKRTSLLGVGSVLLLLVTTLSLLSYGATAPKGRQSNLASGASSTQPRLTQSVDERAYVTLNGNVRPEAKNAVNFRGPAAASLPIEHMLLFLQRSTAQEQSLDKYITSLNDRKSPNFHKWLTPEQYGKYGVADEDIQQVTNWLQSQGFTINQVYPNRMVIDFSGNAGQLANAFRMQMVNLEVNGESHIANFNDPQIPAALAPVIRGFASLNNFHPQPMYRSVTQYTFSPGCTTSTSHPTEPGSCYAVTPQDTQTIYNLNPLYSAGYSGQGQTIALVEDTDTYGGAADWNSYRTAFGLTGYSGTYTQLHPGGCTDPMTNGDDGEAAIDVEVATSVAPSANIQLISCAGGTLTFGGLIALQNMINAAGPYPGVVSVSYGVCEAFNGNGGNAAFYNTYQQAAAQGISVFVSSGDEGPSGCSANFSAGSQYDVASLGVTGWGDSPYNVSVGGTDFEDVYFAKFNALPLSTYWSASNSANFGSAKSYIPEQPWNDACADILIANYVNNGFTTYGASGFCNVSPGNIAAGYLSTGAASGGASNCFSGQGGSLQGANGISNPGCQGIPKPTYQTGAALAGGQAVYGQPADGVRDIPDVSMFAANGVWGHYEVVCWSDPAQTSAGAASCAGAPSTWSGFGGTSISTPTMGAIQALINQKTGQNWGNPNPVYYQIGQNEYGVAGGGFQGTSCDSSGVGGPSGTCPFNDVTQGDIDAACRNNGTAEKAHCYLPASTNGVDSTNVITGATVINGGTGYTSAPTCAIAGPTNNQAYKTPTGATLYAGGSQATCTAAVTTTSTTAVWTVQIAGTTAVGLQLVLSGPSGSPTCGPYTLTGATTAAIATNLVNSIGTGCSLVNLPTRSGSTDTITAGAAGYAGTFNVNFTNNGDLFQTFYVYITNTVKGQGPNYVSAINITGGGAGYQPETPVTLTGVGNGAIAVANTTPGTQASAYQPAYGAAPGYDMATGLGTPNATSLANACSWLPSTSPGIFAPAPNSTLTGTTVTFQWFPNSSATNYWLDVGTTFGGNTIDQSGPLGGNSCGRTVYNLPTDGSTIYVTWWYFIGGSWSYTEYQYTAAGTKGVITTPNPGSTLTGSSQVFTWNPGAGDTAYWIDAGSTPGGNNYFQSGNIGNVTSYNVTNLPTDGSMVYITLFSLWNGQWLNNQYTYTAYNVNSGLAVMQLPPPGSEIDGTSATFSWSPGTGASGYWLDIGTSPGGNTIYQSGNLGLSQMVTVNNLPNDGSQIYATLWTLIGGNWYYNEYQYQSGPSGPARRRLPQYSNGGANRR